MNNEEIINELVGGNIPIENSMSYSRLSDFDRNGPSALIKRSLIDGYGIRIGSIVDDLTLPEDGYVFEDNYIICDYEKPTATLGKLIDIILENYNKIPSKEDILKICKNNRFWKRSKDEIVIANFDTDEFWGYLEVFIQGSVKNIITSKEESSSRNISETLTTHEISRNIFNNDLENINRFKLNFKYNDIVFRGEIDRLIIDHVNKTVQIIDVKTGKYKALEFMDSFLRYRYYLQESVYMQSFDHICEVLNLKGYSLLPFQFLYIGRSELIPLIYTIGDKWHNAAKNGFYINHYRYRGLDQLIDEIKWHFQNRNFEIPMEIYKNNGVISLDDNFIKLND